MAKKRNFSQQYWDNFFGPPVESITPTAESEEEKRRRELEVLQQKSTEGEEAKKFLEKPWYKQIFTKRVLGEVVSKQALKKTGAAVLERLGTTAQALAPIKKAHAPAPGEEIKPSFKEIPGTQILKTPDITVGEKWGRGLGTLIGMVPEFYIPGVAEEAITAKVATRIPQATSFLMKAVRSTATRVPGMAAAGATFRVQAGAIAGEMPTVKDVAKEAGLWTAFAPIPGFMKWASKTKIGAGTAEQIAEQVAKETEKAAPTAITDIRRVPKGTAEARLRPPVVPQPGFDITGKKVADTGFETSLMTQADREAGTIPIIGETRPTLPGETFRGNLAQTLEGQQQAYQTALQEREAFDNLLGKNLIDETKKVLRSRAYATGEIDVAGIPGFNDIVRSVRMGTGRDYSENEILDVIANLKTRSELAKMKPVSLGEFKPDIVPPSEPVFKEEPPLGAVQGAIPPQGAGVKPGEVGGVKVRAGLPTPTEAIPPVGGVETLTSGLAKNTEKLAVENKLTTDFGHLPEYQKMNMKEQASKAVDFIDSDPERALNVALGRELSPPGLYPENVYTAIKLRALKSGDGETLRQLATSPEINAQTTVLGQRIKSLDDQLMNDPVKDMRQVIEYRVNLGKEGNVTLNEAKKISDNSWKVQEKAFSLQNDFTFKGFEDATRKKNLVDYFIAKRKAENYIQFLTPTSKAKIVLSTIGRGNMLLSAKSTLVNIISNTVRGATAFLERRAMALKIGGANNKLAAEYMKFANEIYDKTGYDITRMLSLEDVASIRQGEKVLSAQGPGLIRKVGRFYEDLVYKKMLGKPDLVASSFSFADSANLTSTALAKKEGLKGGALVKRAREIFQDATNPSPATVNGKLVRDQAIKDAMYDTYTNMSLSSKFALGIRKLINLVTGNIGVGEFVEPFAKTPANVAEAGLDAAGLGGIKALYQLPRAIKAARAGEELAFRPVIQNLIKAGVGITGAYLLVSMIKPEDYIGEYPTTPKEKQLFDLNQATANSIKIGNKWISLDYFGPLAAPLVGMLYAKKYGKEGATLQNIQKYIQGAATQITKIPGVQEITGLGKTITQKLAAPTMDVGEEIQSLYNSAVDGLTARVIPAIVSDISKASDKLQRKTDYKKPLTKLQEKIPGWRTGLPEKKTMFGETKYGEPWWLQILSGARIRTATDNNLVNELNRLQKSGNLPALSNIEYSTGRVAEFKNQAPKEKFDQFVSEYGSRLMEEYKKAMMDVRYLGADDKQKASRLDSVKNTLIDDLLEKYGYEKADKEPSPFTEPKSPWSSTTKKKNTPWSE